MDAALELARQVQDLLAWATLIGLDLPHEDSLMAAVERLEEEAATQGVYL